MTDILAQWDLPEINSFIFYPRPDYTAHPPAGAEDHLFPVEPGLMVGGRFYLADPAKPHILFFHGNGEIASDYDDAGPIYNELGVSLLAMDYRGYGKSQGRPSVGRLLKDALILFDHVVTWLQEKERHGPLLIMGRSLGSASALEIAPKRQELIAGLIIESGFAHTLSLLQRVGIPTETFGLSEEEGFNNCQKIAAFTKPTLILHAQYDELIPLDQADELLKNSGAKRKELIIIPGAGHNDIIWRCGRAYFETIARFARSFLPGANPNHRIKKGCTNRISLLTTAFPFLQQNLSLTNPAS